MKVVYTATVIGALLLTTQAQVVALPLMTDSGFLAEFSINIGGYDYTITNQKQESDQWSEAFSGYFGNNYTGYYLGTVTSDKNDSEDDLTRLLNYYLGVSDTYEYTSVDRPDNINDPLTVVYNPDLKSGTWSTVGATPDSYVSFYSVKGANDYALYYINPSLQSGIWTSNHLLTPNGKNIPDISHITVATESAAPVPEPATILLLGTGLVGMAGLARRRRRT